MDKFIEVTDLDNRKRLVNTSWIEEVWSGSDLDEDDYATIYFAFQAENMCDQDSLVVQESYKEIKRKVCG